MGMKARIEKLEKHIPPNTPLPPVAFLEFCDESGVKALVCVRPGLPPATYDDVSRTKQDGRRVIIFQMSPGTVLQPPRKPVVQF